MVRIVTDSAANIPDELVEKHRLAVVPLKVQLNGQTYREGVDLSQEEFFAQLPKANPLPSTSQPSPLEFQEVYEEILKDGDEIISIHLSSDLSGTYNSARNAASALEGQPIAVVDSRSVSAGIALHVLAAAHMVEAGLSRDEIVSRLGSLAPETLLVLTLDTLEYLKKGGRIGGARALLGGLLRVKPLIYIKDGKLEPGERARSRKKAIEQLVQMEVDRFGDQPLWVGLAEAAADDRAVLESLAQERLNIQKLIRCQIGPVVATHTGPGTLGIVAMPAPTL